MDDRELLHEYVANHSERAFAELVARHLSMVLATARRLAPEPQMAADVAQTVFIQLARKAWTIRPEQVLSGWLYRATRRHALNHLRAEQRRLHWETLAMKFAETDHAAEPAPDDLAPLVDEALHHLNRGEQDALLLRFFEDKSYGEVGRLLNLDEKTACQRVNRALEKMRVHFSRRGVTTTAALLGATLSAHAATTVPAEMAATVAGASLTSAGGAALSGSLLKTLFMTLTTKTALAVAAILTVAALTTIHQQHELSTLRTQLAGATTHAQSATKKEPTLAELEATFEKLIIAHDRIGIADFAKTLDPATARALLDFVEKMPANAYTQTAEAGLLGAWAKDNPEAALAWTQDHFDKFHSREALTAIFSGWSEKDPAAALAAVDQTGLPALNSNFRDEILSAVGQKNQQRALELYNSLPLGEKPSTGYSFLGGPFSDDPGAVVATLMTLPSSSARNDQLKSIITGWMAGGEANQQAAVALINSLPPSDARNQMLDTAVEELAFGNDLTEAVEVISNLPSGPLRDDYVNKVLSNLGEVSNVPVDFAAALAWVDQVTAGPVHDKAVTNLLTSVGDSDPSATRAYLEQTSDAAVRAAAIPQLAQTWAKSDPTGTLAWVQSLPDDAGTQQKAINNVMSTWTKSDPATAAAYIQQNFSSDASYGKLVTQAAGNWAGENPAAALDWAESLSSGPAQDAAVSSVVSTYASLDPVAAWTFAQQLPDGDNREASLGSVLVAWSNQEPGQAMALLGDLSPGVVQDATTVKVATNWIKQDPASASAWMVTLPAGPARDGSIVALISAEGKNSLPTAFAWAASIGDSTIQAKQLTTVIQQWAGKDPAAATEAVQSTNLTDEQRTTLLATIQKATTAK